MKQEGGLFETNLYTKKSFCYIWCNVAPNDIDHDDVTMWKRFPHCSIPWTDILSASCESCFHVNAPDATYDLINVGWCYCLVVPGKNLLIYNIEKTLWGTHIVYTKVKHLQYGAPQRHLFWIYRQVSNIRRTKSQHLKYSRTVLWLSLPNPLKPDVKSRMKM